MNDRIIGGLKVVIGADTASFDQGYANVQKDLGRLGSIAKTATIAVAALGAAVATTGAAIGVSLVKNALEANRELSQLASVAGTSASNFEQLAFAARSVGIESDKLADIYKDARDRVGDFITTGAGPLADFFEKVAPLVGVTADEFARLTGPEILEKFTATMQEANLSASQQVFFMEALAGDAARLIPLYADNAAGLRSMVDEAELLQIALSDIQIEQLNQASGAISRVQSVFEAMGDALGAGLAPIIEGLAEEFLDAASTAGSFSDVVTSAIDAVASIIGVLADQIVYTQRDFLEMQRVGLAVSSAISGAWATLAENIAGVMDAIREGWNSIANAIPGLEGMANNSSYADWAAEMRTNADSTAASLSAVEGQIAAIENAPKPSDYIATWLENVRTKSEETAAAIIAAREEFNNTVGVGDSTFNTEDEDEEGGGGGGGGGGGNAVANQMAKRLEILQSGLLSEEEAEIASHERRMEELNAFLQNQMITQQEHDAMVEGLKQQHEDRLAQIRQRAAAAEQQRFSQMAGYITGTLQSISSIMDSEGDKQIAIQKAISLAIAAINVAEGISKALTLPFPMNILAAAQTAAQGLAAIASINRTSRGNPGLSGASSGAASGNAAVAGTPQMPQTMVIRGFDPSYLYSGEQVRTLAESLIQYQRDGGQVVWADK